MPTANMILGENQVFTSARCMKIDFLQGEICEVLSSNLDFSICKSSTKNYYIYENEEKWQQIDLETKFIHTGVKKINEVDIFYGVTSNYGKTQLYIFGRN